jgi:hypothetical protein
MITSTSQFQQVIRESHKVVTKAVIMTGNNPQFTLSIVDGNVKVYNCTNKFRRTADVKLSDPTGTLVPNELTDLLHPLSGNEVWLYRGAYVPSLGVEEYIQLGAFVIKDCEILDSGENLAISVKLYDRSLSVSRARILEPTVVASGTSMGTVIKNVLDVRYPKVKYGMDFTQVRPWITAPAGVIDRTSDPWEVLSKWACDAGLDLMFDNTGMLMLHPLPAGNPSSGDVNWKVIEGQLSPMLSLRKDLTQDNTYNHVMCYSQPTDGVTPVSGSAAITDNRHPLCVTGPMGDIPFFYQSNMFTSNEQCQAVAQSLLYQHAGHSEHVHFNSLVNPCLEAYDIVQVIRTKSKVNAYYSLDSATIPLTATRALECDMRERFLLDVF